MLALFIHPHSPVQTQVQQWYRDQLEAQPVKFMETLAVAALVAAVADAADFLGASWEDVVPVVNATAAVNAVVSSLEPPLKPGDLLLMNTATYPAVCLGSVRPFGGVHKHGSASCRAPPSCWC